MGDSDDKDLFGPHHVERCKGILLENNSARAMLRRRVPLRRHANPLNGPTELLKESCSGKDAALLVPRLRSLDFGGCRGMEPNAHSAGRATAGALLPKG